MFYRVRAAAYAATAFLVVFGASYAPSRAWGYEGEAAAPLLSEHEAAAPEARAYEAVAGESLSFDPNLDTDVVAHAVAPLSEPEDEAEPAGRSLVDLVRVHARTAVDDAEHDCLAGAVYFEAKGEPLRGQLAVAEVILNRAASGRFPTTICGVVKQRSQFSFVRGGRIPAIPRASEAWRKAVAVAHIARERLAATHVGKAMFFHARYVSPGWRRPRVASIGNHIFYR